MKKTIAFATLFSMSSLAAAELDLGVGLKAGTQGLGVELTYPLTESVNVRGGYYYFEYDDDVEDTDVTYDAELDLSNFSLLLDWHLLGGGFRITAGLVSYSDGSISGTAEPDAGLTYTINDTVYSAADIADLRASVKYGSTAPYIGVGWGNAVGPGNWSFALDIGLINLGSADVDVNFQCKQSFATDCAQLQADVQTEIDELEDDADDLEWWPVINLGIALKF